MRTKYFLIKLFFNILQISSIFYYLCVVTLQFVAPLILCLYLTLMYKSLGGFSWTGVLPENFLQPECAADLEPTFATEKEFIEGSGMEGGTMTLMSEETETDFNIFESAQNLQNSIMSLKNVSVVCLILTI